MLTYYGVYNDLELQLVVLLTVIFIAGGITALLIKYNKSKLWVSLCLTAVLLILEAGILLPTPKALSGDGYAFTQEISLISATYFAPFLFGVLLCFAIKFVIGIIKNKKKQS